MQETLPRHKSKIRQNVSSWKNPSDKQANKVHTETQYITRKITKNTFDLAKFSK